MRHIKRFILPIFVFLLALFFKYVIQEYELVLDEYIDIFDVVGSVLLIASVSWLFIAILRTIKHILLEQFNSEDQDNLRSRKFHTQFNILERIIVFLIILIAIGLTLMLFEDVKRIGISLFASAGIAGIILGLAAQRILGLIIAGLQIAITQPIRLDDVVIIENEWGRIEEITLTYVVVKIWDLRRLIVPTTYFFEKPFQNWTRTSAEILGTVFIYTDYNVSFDAIRAELTRLLEASPHWNGKTNVLQVTNAKEQVVEIRALMSANDSPSAWNLRVFVRENLISFLQRNYPESLPKTRILLQEENSKQSSNFVSSNNNNSTDASGSESKK